MKRITTIQKDLYEIGANLKHISFVEKNTPEQLERKAMVQAKILKGAIKDLEEIINNKKVK